MKRIFPDAIEAYFRLGNFYSSDDPESYIAMREYEDRCPTFQDFFRRISNRKAIEAGVKMGIVSTSQKSSNKKKTVALRSVMNLFRIIPPRSPNENDPAPSHDFIFYGFNGTHKNGYPSCVWVEYFWNPLEVIAQSRLSIEDDDAYQVAIALADYYRMYYWNEFCELSKKYLTCCIK